MQPSATSKRTIMVAFIAVLVWTVAAEATAGDLTGQVTILDKSGRKPLKSSAQAIVYLEGPVKTHAGTVTLDQRSKEFIPRLLPVIIGQKVRFTNSDVFQHNVFSPHAQESFDLGRYGTGEAREIEFKEIGPHPIYCDIHQKMVADIFVVPNRYFALTDDKGRFRIADVPPGTYQLRGWHILGGKTAQKVEVARETVSIALSMQSTKLLREMEEHKNKEGRSYPPEFEFSDY